MDRRLFLTLTGAAVAAPAHEWLLANATGDVARPGSTALPADVVDHLDTITARLRRMDDQLGGASLLNLVRGQLRYVINLIENHRYPETVGRRLHATAAELLPAAHSFAGHCYLHLRDWGRARSHLCSALRLQDASFAREGALRRLRLATTYLRQERPELDEALSLGTHAIETSTGTVWSALGIADLTRVVDGLAPYRRRPAVREFIDRAAELKRRAA